MHSAKLSAQPATERANAIHDLNTRIHGDMARLRRIIRNLDSHGVDYSADDVVKEFERHTREYTLFNYMSALISALRRTDRIRTMENYLATLNSFRKFRRDTDIMIDSLTKDVIAEYEAWLRGRGNTPNTTSFYMRNLRATYNRAVEDGITDNRNPFRHVYTGVDKTVKRALPLRIVRRIKELDLSAHPRMDFARDMFMLSFYLRGMSLIDMAFLRKSDLRFGHVSYRRRKTGQLLDIKWTKEMQAIVDKHPAGTSPYLLPIVGADDSDTRRIYRNAGCNINYHLRKIASMAGIDTTVTMYCARHSWASAAKSKGIPLGVISEGLGHDSESTTRIYLSTLETSVIDKANSLIINSL